MDEASTCAAMLLAVDEHVQVLPQVRPGGHPRAMASALTLESRLFGEVLHHIIGGDASALRPHFESLLHGPLNLNIR